jgi:hypothetical protein
LRGRESVGGSGPQEEGDDGKHPKVLVGQRHSEKRTSVAR